MADDMNSARRTFVGAAVLAIAAGELANIRPASAQTRKAQPIKPGTHKSFASLKQVLELCVQRQFLTLLWYREYAASA